MICSRDGSRLAWHHYYWRAYTLPADFKRARVSQIFQKILEFHHTEMRLNLSSKIQKELYHEWYLEISWACWALRLCCEPRIAIDQDIYARPPEASRHQALLPASNLYLHRKYLPHIAKAMSSSQPFQASSPLSAGEPRRKKSKFTYRQLSQLAVSATNCPLRVIAHVDLDAFYAQCEMIRLGVNEDQPLAVQQW